MSVLRSRRVLAALAAAGLALGGVFAAGGSAQAADGRFSGSNWEAVEWDTATGDCWAEVDLVNQYAYGGFVNDDSGLGCTAWLERSTDSGASWHLVSGTHDLAPGDVVSTYDYWDGNGYLARACFHFDFSGAATHCSNGI